MLDIINSFFTNGSPIDGKMLEICFPDAMCNMKCEYCYGNQKTRTCQGSVILNKDILRSKIEPLKNDVSFVHLWGGELLFNKELFKECVSFVREILPDKDIHLVTNGLLLPEWAQYLIDNRIFIGISHDGPGQKYRGFDFLNSEKHIDSIKRLYDAGLFHTFKVVLHAKNYSIKDIHEYFKRVSDKLSRKLAIDTLIIMANKESRLLFKTDEDFENLKKSIEWMIQDIIKNINDTEYIKQFYSRTNLVPVFNAMINLYNGTNPDIISVCAGSKGYSFTSDGKRLPCHCFSERASLIEKDVSVNLEERLKSCMGCEVNYLCGGGCLALAGEAIEITCKTRYTYFKAIVDTLRPLINKIKGDLEKKL